MDKIVKKQILQEINALEVSDLLELIQSNDIRLEEMVDSGLERVKLHAVQKQLNQANSGGQSNGVATQDANEELKTLCLAIEKGEYDVLDIRWGSAQVVNVKEILENFVNSTYIKK
jgi:hypothetical protein